MIPILRIATLEDADRIAEIHRTSRASSMPWLPVVHTAEEDRWFYRNIVIPDQHIEVAEINGEVVGFCATDERWLNHLYVHPNAQGHGIGSALLKSAMKRCVELNLWVFQRNTNAQAFYTSHGFEEVTRTDGADNEEKTPDIQMRWAKPN